VAVLYCAWCVRLWNDVQHMPCHYCVWSVCVWQFYTVRGVCAYRMTCSICLVTTVCGVCVAVLFVWSVACCCCMDAIVCGVCEGPISVYQDITS